MHFRSLKKNEITNLHLSYVLYVLPSSQSVASTASMTRFCCLSMTHPPTTFFSWLKEPVTFRRGIWWRWCSLVGDQLPSLPLFSYLVPLQDNSRALSHIQILITFLLSSTILLSLLSLCIKALEISPYLLIFLLLTLPYLFFHCFKPVTLPCQDEN